ncbi:MAG: hypothetical protein ACYCPT_03860 [Acidimicrobiales bacterium]
MSNWEEKMLRALLQAGKNAENNMSRTPINIKMNELIKSIDKISVDDKFDIGSIIVANNCSHLLQEINDGFVIDLNKLPECVIDEMYSLLNWKLNSI